MTRDGLRLEAERLHEDVIHTEKGLFAAASAWSNVHLWIGVAATIAAALAGASGLKDVPTLTVVAGVLAAILAGLLTFLHPSETAKEYLDAGREFASLRGALRRFINLDGPDGDSGTLRARLEELADRKTALDNAAPTIPGWAFRRGRASIAASEPAYEADQK